MRVLIVLTFMIVLITGVGCSRNNVHARTPTDIFRTENAYTNLEPGWRLRIVVPLLKSGWFRPSDLAARTEGGTISLSSEDLIGYTVSYYAITGKRNGSVRLKFASAEITRNGKTVLDPNPLSLPFQLPRRGEHIRLIFLVRVSQADHNMAIVASKHFKALNAFTKRLEQNPNVCTATGEIFCSWIPAGVAVRPEEQ